MQGGRYFSKLRLLMVMLVSIMISLCAFSQPRDILFTTQDGFLAQINSDGTGLTLLNLDGFSPRWSPDGTKFAFLVSEPEALRIAVADADGSNVRTLDVEVGLSVGLQWSPDGRYLAFLADEFRLSIVSVEDGSVTDLGVQVGFETETGFPLRLFTWTPDGTRILFPDQSGNLAYVRISDRSVTPLNIRGVDPVFHPSGSFFIFVATEDEINVPTLFVSDANGTNVRSLNLQGSNPILSPNGQFLLFTDGRLFVQQIDSTGNPVGEPVNLGFSPLIEGLFASWSPDSQRIVTRVGDDTFGGNQIVIVNRDGTGLRSLNVSGFEPQWRPRVPSEFLVTTDADSGPGSLREIINQANAANFPVTIRFQQGFTIRLQSPLPDLTNPYGITIVGDLDGDGTPDVTIDGTNIPRSRQVSPRNGLTRNGLTITTPNNTVDGLIIQNFPENGIAITSSAANNNTVRNCVIQNNGANGVLIENDASQNNVTNCSIRSNTLDGVRVVGDSSVRNRISRNRISANGRLGINLVGGIEDANGVTANDANDADSGPNNLQNFPELISAVNFAGTVAVQGRIDTPNPTTVTIEIYSNTSADPSGFGEGERFLATVTPTSDGRFLIDLVDVAEVQFITAVAIDEEGNTSEFSRSVIVTPPPPAPQLLSPIGGAVVSTTPSFRLRAPSTTGLGRVQFLIELSQDNFATIARVIEPGVANGWNKEDYAPDEEAIAQIPEGSPLPTGNWQWRAITIDITRQVESNFSAPQNFVAVAQPTPPNLLEPADNALVSITPTFKIQGTLPSGDPTRLVYFLELSQDNFATIARTIEPGTANGWDKADYGPDEVAVLNLPSAQELTEGQWQWRVRAALATQPNVQSAPTSPRSFTALNNRNRIPAGVSLVGLPFVPAVPTRQGLGLAANTRVAVYDTLIGNYRLDGDAEPLPVNEGKAFWVRSTGAQSPQVSGTAFTFPVAIQLMRGWNAIGNPLAQPLVWKFTAPTNIRISQGGREFTLGDAIRKGLVSAFVWVWDETENRYELVYDPDILPAQSGDPFRNDVPAWRGFWILAKVDNLYLVIDRSPRIAPLVTRRAKNNSSDGFLLALTLNKDGKVVGTALVGLRSNLPNRLTVPSPPPAPDGKINALVLDDGNSADIRTGKQKQVWNIQVSESGELRWSGLIPRNWRATLIDPATNTQVAIRYQSRYQVQSGQRLILVLEPETGQPLRIVNLKARQFRGRSLQISFALTAPAEANVTIMTLTGRKIAVLRSGNRSAGTHQFLWSGTDNNKQIVPAGIYLIQVQVEDEIGRKAQAIQTVMLR